MVWLFFLAGLIINAICFFISTYCDINHVNILQITLLISILLVIIYNIKQKKTLRQTLRTTLTFMLGVLTVSILMLCQTLFKGNLINYMNKTSFNSNIWKQTEPKNESTDSPRIDMIDDLLKTHHLIGKSRSEIDALLGVPTHTESDSESLTDKNDMYMYPLGKKEYEFNKFVDFYFLVITFDNNIVSKVHIKEIHY